MPRPKKDYSQVESKHYALTIVPSMLKNKTVELVKSMLEFLRVQNQFDIIDEVIEYKKDRTPHIHAWICGPHEPYFKKYSMIGYSFKVEQIYNKQGWSDYLRKAQEDKLPSEAAQQFLNGLNPLDWGIDPEIPFPMDEWMGDQD